MDGPAYSPPLDADLARLVERLAPDHREWFEERCAIREFDGGMSRREAERAAWGDLHGCFGSVIPELPRQPDQK